MTVPKLRAVALVFIIGFALGLSVFAASRLLVRSVLGSEARSAVADLATRIAQHVTVDAQGSLASIQRFTTFDEKGNASGTTVVDGSIGLPPVATEAARQAASAARQAGEIVLVQPPLLPSLLGLAAPGIRSAAAPLSGDNAVYVELDQSGAIEGMLRTFSMASIVIMGLTVLATLATLAAVTRRVRERRATGEEALQRDPLSGLPTRAAFSTALSESVEAAARADHQIGLMVIDLNGLRTINDVWGHAVGDEVIKTAAARLASFAQRPGTLARIAGDDFALIVEKDATSHSLRGIANEIRTAVAAPYEIGGKIVTIGASIGAALYPVNADRPEVLFQAADSALSKAKKQGRNSLAFFDTDMEKRMKRRVELEHDLKQALDRGEFVVFYQPQLELASGTLRGYEALIRWERPGDGIVPPRDFLSVAEEMGLIVSIGEWVLRKACADAAAWSEPGIVAVNFCAAQIKAPDVDQMIARVLAETKLPPERLEIEVPESLFLQSEPGVMDTLRRLKGVGVRIAMDDFGAGYSGLASLAQFPFDKIKIDKAFVTQLTEDSDIAAIVASIVALGRLLSVDVTAEGVERRDQVTLLRAAGCSIVQGFLFGAPQRKTIAEGEGRSGAANAEPVPPAEAKIAAAS